MKDWKLRMASGLLALGLVCAAPAPAMARTPEHPAGGWVSGLMDLPVVGDLLRLLTGGGEEAAGGEGASTAETAATAETATAESAETAKAAPAEAAAPQPWPQSWMQGAVQPGVELPRADADDPALPDALTATQWAALPVGEDTLSLTSREETNFGDLTADAAAQAAAAWLWRQGEATADLRSLPVAAAIPGELLTRSAAAGTTLADLGGCLAEGDLSLAMVQITPARLVSVLETGLADREDPTGEGYGLFLQLSGLRMTYTETEGTARVAELALADPEEEAGRALALDDEQTPLLLVLPRACLETFGLTEAEGCPDLLADAGLTLPDALAALPANLGAADTAALLDRTAPAGRVLPADAADAAFTGVVELGADYAGLQIRLLVDGREVTAVTDAQGRLTLPGLAGGGHTLQMAAGEPAYYLSDRTGVGTGAEGSVPVTVTAVPADCVLGPAATATPAPTPTAAPTASPAPTATPAASASPAPTAAPTAAPATVTVTSPEEEPATPAPTAAPTPVPAATAAPTARPTAAPIFDPTAEMLQATPDPTLAPTATPAPTAEPTPDPARLEEQEAARKTSSQLPLYIGLGLAAVGAAVVAVVLVRRKLTARSGHTYRRKP